MGSLAMHPEKWARLLYPGSLLTLACLTAVVVALAVIVRHRALLAFDLKVTLKFQEANHPWVGAAARWLTFMGNSATLAILAVATLGIAYTNKLLSAGVFAAMSLAALPLNMLLKNLFDKERPGEREVAVYPGPRWGFSFPSGHAMGSAAFYGFLAFLVRLYIQEPTIRAALMTPFVSLPLLIGVSRIYLGAHWLSDVVAGLAAGLVVVMILAALYPV